MTTPLRRWTKELEQLKALSIKQPWAWLIVNGHKDVENRSWATSYQGSLLIHAGLNKADFEADREHVLKEYGIEVPDDVEFGGIVGMVDLREYVEKSHSRWHIKEMIGWVMENPARLPFRRVKGQLQLFAPKFD